MHLASSVFSQCRKFVAIAIRLSRETFQVFGLFAPNSTPLLPKDAMNPVYVPPLLLDVFALVSCYIFLHEPDITRERSQHNNINQFTLASMTRVEIRGSTGSIVGGRIFGKTAESGIHGFSNPSFTRQVRRLAIPVQHFFQLIRRRRDRC